MQDNKEQLDIPELVIWGCYINGFLFLVIVSQIYIVLPIQLLPYSFYHLGVLLVLFELFPILILWSSP